MKLSVFVACLLVAASMMAQAPNSIHSSGAFANVFAFASGSDIFLNVTRSDNNGVTRTFLNLDIFSFSPDGFTDTFAFGQIPNDSLKGDNSRQLNLNLDTSQMTSFGISTCTFSFSTETGSCGPGPTGVIQLEFQQDGNITVRTVSDASATFFQSDVHTQQNSDSASALVNGAILGIPLINISSNIGTNHDTTITLTPTH